MKDLQKTMLLIKDSVRKLYDAQQEKKQFDKYYEEVRKKEQLAISNFMFTSLPEGQNSFEIELDEGEGYYTNHVKLNVTRVRTKKVTWLLDKLKQKVGKDIYSEVVNKTYTVNDMQGLIRYLKTCGVDPKKFKRFIDVTEELDETKLDTYYETGALKTKDIEGCYTVKMGEPYIRITELKR
ncbi:hypothetical protein CS266P3_00028 [Clostridium phage CS266P3]|nr:hypothetical protein CS266P3_00028 [Clostridium phage CS266P3]